MGATEDAGLLALRVRRLSRELSYFYRSNEDLHFLTFVEAHVMELVIREPGATLGELAVRARLKKSNLSTAVAALTKRGFVERRSNQEDGRLVHIYPTAKAQKNLDGLIAFWGSLVEQGLDEEEVAQLANMSRLIDKISDTLAQSELQTSE